MKKIALLMLTINMCASILQGNKKPFIFSFGGESSSDIYQSIDDKNTQKSLFLIKKFPEEIKEALFIMPDRRENILHLAASRGDTQTVKALLELLEDANEKKKLLLLSHPDSGMTVFHYAALYGHLETLQYVSSTAASVGLDLKKIFSLTNSGGHTIFHFAAQYGFLEMLRFIYSINPDLVVVRRGINGRLDTPLHLAAEMGHLNVVTYLVSLHKDAHTMKNINGDFPIDLAKAMRKGSLVAYLSSLDGSKDMHEPAQNATANIDTTIGKRSRMDTQSRYIGIPSLGPAYKKQKR